MSLDHFIIRGRIWSHFFTVRDSGVYNLWQSAQRLCHSLWPSSISAGLYRAKASSTLWDSVSTVRMADFLDVHWLKPISRPTVRTIMDFFILRELAFDETSDSGLWRAEAAIAWTAAKLVNYKQFLVQVRIGEGPIFPIWTPDFSDSQTRRSKRICPKILSVLFSVICLPAITLENSL